MLQFIIEGVGVWRQKPECHLCSNIDKGLNTCQRCYELFCEDCSSVFNQFTQIDYDCCESCANKNYSND